MFILFGIICAIIIVALETFLGINGSDSLMGLFILRFIPMGAIIYGMAMAFIVTTGVKLQNKQPKSKVYGAVAAILALVSVFGVNYLEYATTYIDAEGYITRDSSGESISAFAITGEDGEDIPMNFINYTKYTVENSTFVETSRHSKKETIINSSVTSNAIRYFSTYIVMALTALIGVFSALSSSPYCYDCKKYFKKKKLFTFFADDYQEENEEFLQQLSLGIDIKDFVKKKRSKDSKKFYDVSLDYCKECNTGCLIYNAGKVGSKERIIEHVQKIEEIQVQSIVNSLQN